MHRRRWLLCARRNWTRISSLRPGWRRRRWVLRGISSLSSSFEFFFCSSTVSTESAFPSFVVYIVWWAMTLIQARKLISKRQNRRLCVEATRVRRFIRATACASSRPAGKSITIAKRRAQERCVMSGGKEARASIYFHPPAIVAISVIYSMWLCKVCMYQNCLQINTTYSFVVSF